MDGRSAGNTLYALWAQIKAEMYNVKTDHLLFEQPIYNDIVSLTSSNAMGGSDGWATIAAGVFPT